MAAALQRRPGEAGAAWPAGPRLGRDTGCCHRTSIPDRGLRSASLPGLYDAVIYFERSTPSRLLPVASE